MQKKFLRIFLFLFIIQLSLTAQVSYSGPAAGSVSSGVTVNTNTFVEETPAEPRLKLFTHSKNEILPPPADALPPTGPEGSNLFIDPSSLLSEAIQDEDITLFEDFYGINQTSSIPPDPYLAVGPNHIIQVVNTSFRISTKEGQTITTINGSSFYSSTLSGASPFDPKVLYDQFEERWVMVWLHLNQNNNQAYFLISVSDDSDPNGTWYNWRLSSTVNGNSYAGNWADYQGVGYDDKAIYITSNQFGFDGYYDYTKLRIIPKSDLYSGSAGSVSWQDIWDISYPNSSSGSFGIRPARMQTASDDYYLAVHGPYSTNSTFGVYTLKNPLTNPQLEGAQIPVTAYSSPNNPQQLGGGSPLIDGGGYNLRNEPVYQDGVLHMVHSVANSSRSALRYLAVNTSDNSVVNDWAMGDNSHYHTYPGLAVNGFGDVIFSYSRSASNEYMGAYYTVLKSGETNPVGSLTLKAGNGNYVKTYGGSRNRWGDYNGAWMDPVNPDQFWILTEYVYSTNNWGVWVGGISVENVGTTVVWETGLNVSSGSGSQTLSFGQSHWASDGIDENLNEEALSAAPPASTFDARFTLPTSQQSLRDFRADEETNIIWEVNFQPGSSGYPVTLSWNPETLYDGLYQLKDPSGGNIFTVNMGNTGTYTITDPSITSVLIEYNEQYSSTVTVTDKWNIVSVPLQLEDMSTGSVFPQATSPAYSFNGSYNQVSEFETGAGYWVKFNSSENIQLQGSQVNTNNIPVNAGWNIIGPYEQAIDVENISTEPTGIITSSFFGFDQQYNIAETLLPGKGYWVKTSQSGVISPASPGKANKSIANDLLKDMVKIVVTDADGRTAILYGSGHNNLSAYELPPAPPEGVFDVRFSDNKFAADIKTAKTVNLNNLTYPVTISTEGNKALTITGEVTGKGISGIATSEKPFVLENSKITTLKISADIIPATAVLNQNYPNPFNPETKISFALPYETKVKISVYNILGEVVAVPVNDILPAGTHSIDFNASGLSSGTYIYRLITDNNTITKKMIVLK